MLTKTAPGTFEAPVGDTVTIAAIARNNNGVEGATFRYGAKALPTRQVQGHPGCRFDVDAGVVMFGALVLFDPGSPGAVYDLFQLDGAGNLQALAESVDPLSGPILQLQITGVPVAVLAGAKKKKVKKAAKAAKKPKPAKKTAKAAKTPAKKAVKKAAKKAVKTGKKAAKGKKPAGTHKGQKK
jgi:hypothetical protein